MNADRRPNVERAVQRDLESEEETPLLSRVRKLNRILVHNYQAEVPKTLFCSLQECEVSFKIKLIPGQILYPLYCPKHRSEYRRKRFEDR